MPYLVATFDRPATTRAPDAVRASSCAPSVMPPRTAAAISKGTAVRRFMTNLRGRAIVARASGGRPSGRPFEAIGGMVIDHPDRLHEGIADGRPDELESAPAQIAAERIGLG